MAGETQIGHENLAVREKVKNYMDWIFSEIKPYIHGNILEVGSALGTFSKKLVDNYKDNEIVLSDVDPGYVKKLKNRFRNKNVTSIIFDLTNFSPHDFENKKIQTIIASFVLEHIKDDISCLKKLYDLLDEHGNLIIIVPAYKFLFNPIDESLGHYHRYNKKDIQILVSKTKFKIAKVFYFNSIPIIPWYIMGNILKKSAYPSGKFIKLYDNTVPIIKKFEKYILRYKLGSALIIILKK